MQVAHSSAHFVTIDKRADSSRPAQKYVPPNRLSLADWMIFARVERNGCSNYNKAVTVTRNFTIRRKHPSVAFTPSFGSSASRRPTDYRRSRRFQRFI